MATSSKSYKEEAIRYHELKALEMETKEIRSSLYPKIENLDYEIVHEFWKYLREVKT